MQMSVKIFIGSLCIFIFTVQQLSAQTSTNEPDIRHRLEMIEKGQAEAIRAELSSLMTNYQNNPGVMYLQATLTTDGAEAAKIYQNIVDNFPTSEWGDDALYKLYQYFYSIGLYKTANKKFSQLKEEYPFSTYATDQNPIAEEKPIEKGKTAEKEKATEKEKPIEKAIEKPAAIKQKGTIQKYVTNFTVQIGVFSVLQNAEDSKAKFEREGYTSNIISIVKGEKKIHKVWVGEFQTYSEAKEFTQVIRNKFDLESIVVSR